MGSAWRWWFDGVGKEHVRRLDRLAEASRASGLRGYGLGPDSAGLTQCSSRSSGSVYVTRPALADYIADPAEKSELAGEIFGTHCCRSDCKIEINQRYQLQDADQAHRRIQARKTTGSLDLCDLALTTTTAAPASALHCRRQPQRRRHDMTNADIAAPAVAREGMLGSIKVERLDLRARRRAVQREFSSVASRNAGAGDRDPRASAPAQSAVLSRPGHHAG